MRSVNNGLGVFVVAIILAVTPLVPYATGSSAAVPNWQWNEDGTVYDANGLYRSMTREEVCMVLGWGCQHLTLLRSAASGSSASSADGGGPGGCR